MDNSIPRHRHVYGPAFTEETRKGTEALLRAARTREGANLRTDCAALILQDSRGGGGGPIPFEVLQTVYHSKRCSANENEGNEGCNCVPMVFLQEKGGEIYFVDTAGIPWGVDLLIEGVINLNTLRKV